MEKLRILFVLLQLEAGGSERVVFDLAKNLPQDQFEIFVASFKSGTLLKPLSMYCKGVFIIEKKHGTDILAMLKLSRIVKDYRIDVVNAHHYMPCFYSFLGTRVLNDKRLVFTEHSVPEVENVANCFHKKIFNWMVYRINAVVGVSKAITEKFREKYPCHIEKFHLILNGVDIEKFERKDAREEVRSDWGFAKEHFVVGTVANFRAVKNHVCLVRAASRLKDSYPLLRLFFIGTGFPGDVENSEDEVKALIQDLGMQDRVIFAGYQDNIPKILSAFDAFCLPSFSEGLPVSLLEAMAAGVPVLASNVKGIVEVIQNGRTGFLFPCNNDLELSNSLKIIIDSPAITQLMVDNAFTFVKRSHNLQRWVASYSSILNGVTSPLLINAQSNL